MFKYTKKASETHLNPITTPSSILDVPLTTPRLGSVCPERMSTILEDYSRETLFFHFILK